MILHAKGRHKKTVFFSEKIQKGGVSPNPKGFYQKKMRFLGIFCLKGGILSGGGLARFFFVDLETWGSP